MTDVTEIKGKTDLLSLAQRVTPLKKVATTGGGEYAGPCPFCPDRGEDRFRVQLQAPPGKKPQGARWMCRHCCTQWGDVIGFVMRRDNVGFQDALENLANDTSLKPIVNVEQQSVQPYIDREQWQRTALEFITDSAINLCKDEGISALAYLKSRGLNADSLFRWDIGYNPNEGYGDPEQWGLSPDESIWIPRGIVIPCIDDMGLHYIKIRRRVGDPKYIILKGGEFWIFGAPTLANADIAFLFESEFDAMLAGQSGLNLGHISMPAGQKFQKEWAPLFTNIEDMIIAMDNDDAGQIAAEKLCRLSPHFYKAHPFPTGNDLTEYCQASGDSNSVFEWVYDQLSLIKPQS
jgi:DNA primase